MTPEPGASAFIKTIELLTEHIDVLQKENDLLRADHSMTKLLHDVRTSDMIREQYEHYFAYTDEPDPYAAYRAGWFALLESLMTIAETRERG